MLARDHRCALRLSQSLVKGVGSRHTKHNYLRRAAVVGLLFGTQGGCASARFARNAV